MGTEVLRPQNCLIERIRMPPAVFTRRKSYGNSSSNANVDGRVNRKQIVRLERPDQKKRLSDRSISKRSISDELRTVKSGLVMDKVTILRRGELLDSKIRSEPVALKNRSSPDPDPEPKQIRMVDMRSPMAGKLDVYAGSAFAVSPEPSSLPLPSFSKKKQVMSVDDSATRDLRRLLRLD